MKKGAGSRNPRNAQIDIPARLPKIKVKEPTGSRRKQNAGKYQHYGAKGHSAGKRRKYPVELGQAVGADPHGRDRKNAYHRHTPLCLQHHSRHNHKNVQRGGGNGRKLNVSQIGKGKHRFQGHQHQDDLLQFLFRQSDPISLSKTLHIKFLLVYLFAAISSHHFCAVVASASWLMDAAYHTPPHLFLHVLYLYYTYSCVKSNTIHKFLQTSTWTSFMQTIPNIITKKHTVC